MKITLFVTAGSPFCQQAKDYITSKGLPFEEKDVEFNKDNLNEMLALSDNFKGVPFAYVVFDDNSEAGLRGFTKDEYDQVFAHVNKGIDNDKVVADTPMPISSPDQDQPQEEGQLHNQTLDQTAQASSADVSHGSQTQPVDGAYSPSTIKDSPGVDQVPSLSQNTSNQTVVNLNPGQDKATDGVLVDNHTQTIGQESDQAPQVNQANDQNKVLDSSQELGSVMDVLASQSQTTSAESLTNAPTANPISIETQPNESGNVVSANQSQSTQPEINSARTDDGKTPNIPDFPK